LAMEWNIYKRVPPQVNVKMPRIQSHFGHTWFFFFAFAFVPLLFHFCHILYDSRYGIDHTFVGMHVGMDRKTIVETTPTTRNLVVCNPSMCDYVQPNVACNYKWLPMQLFFKFGWSLVFFSTRLQLWLISSLKLCHMAHRLSLSHATWNYDMSHGA
jgi:hypothetical protein